MHIEKFKGQTDIVKYEELQLPIHIIGAGGIGSWTAFFLAKMGCENITVYDMDEVEEHNSASQFYRPSQIGEDKLISLHTNIKEQTDYGIIVKEAPEEENIKEGLVIIALDSMERRHEMAEILSDKDVFIIDGRMGGLQLEIYRASANSYVDTLVDPDDVDTDPCTAKAICFNCSVIAGLICNYVRLYVQGDSEQSKIIFGFNNGLQLLK